MSTNAFTKDNKPIVATKKMDCLCTQWLPCCYWAVSCCLTRSHILFEVGLFYCWFMLSGLMSSSTSQQKMRAGWSQAYLQLSGQWRGHSIDSSIYEQLCCVTVVNRTWEMQQQVSKFSFLFQSIRNIKFKIELLIYDNLGWSISFLEYSYTAFILIFVDQLCRKCQNLLITL